MVTEVKPMQHYGIAQTLDDLVAEVTPQLQELACNPQEIDEHKLATQIVHLVTARIFERLAGR